MNNAWCVLPPTTTRARSLQALEKVIVYKCGYTTAARICDHVSSNDSNGFVAFVGEELV